MRERYETPLLVDVEEATGEPILCATGGGKAAEVAT
jgi:hypothetical protein